MSVKSIRSPAVSWLSRIRTVAENFFDGTSQAGMLAPTKQRDPLSGLRCVWYGRAMFCLYLPNVPAQAMHPLQTPLTAKGDQPSDLDARAQLDHPVVWELEEFDRAACIAAHCGE
jgi:hypothetical protein